MIIKYCMLIDFVYSKEWQVSISRDVKLLINLRCYYIILFIKLTFFLNITEFLFLFQGGIFQ